MALGLLTGVFGGGPRYLAARTCRTLRALGAEPIEIASDAGWTAAIDQGARWFVRAGAVPLARPAPLPPSSTGRPVLTVGAVRGDAAMQRALRDTGGDLTAHDGWRDLRFASALLCERMAARVAARSSERPTDHVARDGTPLDDVGDARVLHAPHLDAAAPAGLRVAEIVTSLQIGGAERIARSLAEELPRLDVAARLFALGRPTRARLTGGAGRLDEVELHVVEPDARRRVARLVAEVLAWGADVAHVHLAGDDVIDALADAGLAPVVTIHNAAPGWPRGTDALDARRARIVVGCAIAVDRALRDAGVRAPVRAVQNGIAPPAPRRADARAETRAAWGAADGDIVLLVVANPRPQKRFDRIAPIAAALARATERPVRVVHCGAPSGTDESAIGIARALRAALDGAGIPLVALGAVTDLGAIYDGADALLCTSDWEGLSLAHLEAVAHGLPVVATDVGGTREIAASAPDALALVDVDAPPAAFVHALARVRPAPRPDGSSPESTLPPRFALRSMARAYARLLREAARAPAPRALGEAAGPLDVVLLTNNFAPGGAQSSARRLLAELRRRGRRVLAATIEERPEQRTPGCAALEAAGVELLVLPRAPAAVAVRTFFDAIDARGGARAILLWNAIAEHKVLVADGALDARVVDVSPGEMYFTSLARFFDAGARPDVGCASALDYGRLLDGVVVKFTDERARAEEVLGRPADVVPNGVALAPTGTSPRARDATAPFRFGTSVRIHPHKRLDLLLDAFDQIVAGAAGTSARRVELAILGAADAGCDAHLAELRARGAHLPLSWLGFSEDVDGFLSSLDAFVLVAEPAGCPNASLEALAHGLPTLATDVGGMREQLGGGAGILVGREDVRGLAAAMISVRDDALLRGDLSRRARDTVRERFSVERMADAYERVLGLTTAPR